MQIVAVNNDHSKKGKGNTGLWAKSIEWFIEDQAFPAITNFGSSPTP